MTNFKGMTKLTSEWHDVGIRLGDAVLIHSSLRRILKEYEVTPYEVLQSLIGAVGSTGTVVFPLFNFDFTEGVPFDIRSTPSHMGVLTEAARTHPDVVRSGHPIYSFGAIGYNAEAFRVDNYSGYGIRSPFAILLQLNGKIAVIDLDDQNSMTFYHHVEEMYGVEWRYYKTFGGEYTNADGNTEHKSYQLFVRNIDKGVETHVNPMGDILWKEGFYRGKMPGQGCGMRTISARDLYFRTGQVISSGDAKGILYTCSD